MIPFQGEGAGVISLYLSVESKSSICIATSTNEYKNFNFNLRFLHHLCIDFNEIKGEEALSKYFLHDVYKIFVSYIFNKVKVGVLCPV